MYGLPSVLNDQNQLKKAIPMRPLPRGRRKSQVPWLLKYVFISFEAWEEGRGSKFKPLMSVYHDIIRCNVYV